MQGSAFRHLHGMTPSTFTKERTFVHTHDHPTGGFHRHGIRHHMPCDWLAYLGSLSHRARILWHGPSSTTRHSLWEGHALQSLRAYDSHGGHQEKG